MDSDETLATASNEQAEQERKEKRYNAWTKSIGTLLLKHRIQVFQ